jgi:hypothetical protein
MSQGLKNIFVLGLVVTLLVLAYFLFLQPNPELAIGGDDAQSAAVLAQAQLFVERRTQLTNAEMDIDFFNDERFISLKSYKTPEPDQLLGKSDLFAEPLSTDAATVSDGAVSAPATATTEVVSETPTEAE